MVTKTETINNQRFITSYSYDEHDRMTSKTYPSGKLIGYVYDDKGELVSLNIDSVPFISDIKTNDNGLPMATPWTWWGNWKYVNP